MNDVLELIGHSLRYEYDDPDHAGNPVEGGQYVFSTMTTGEVLDEVGPITENEKVLDEMLGSFSDSFWIEKPCSDCGRVMSFGTAGGISSRP
jgi:hypothetical protein